MNKHLRIILVLLAACMLPRNSMAAPKLLWSDDGENLYWGGLAVAQAEPVTSLVSTQGLVGYWKFENDYTDSFSLTNTLSTVGTPTFSGSGTQGSALVLDGASSAYTEMLDAWPTGRKYVSIALWLKDIVNDAGIVAGWDYFTPGFGIGIAGNVVHSKLYEGTTEHLLYTSASNIDVLNGDGLWHFFALTYNGTNVVYYLDGSEIDTEASTGTIADVSPARFAIGALRYATVSASYSTFTIDELSLWSRTLSASEVMSIYTQNCSLVTASTGTVATAGLTNGAAATLASLTVEGSLAVGGKNYTGTNIVYQREWLPVSTADFTTQGSLSCSDLGNYYTFGAMAQIYGTLHAVAANQYCGWSILPDPLKTNLQVLAHLITTNNTPIEGLVFMKYETNSIMGQVTSAVVTTNAPSGTNSWTVVFPPVSALSNAHNMTLMTRFNVYGTSNTAPFAVTGIELLRY